MDTAERLKEKLQDNVSSIEDKIVETAKYIHDNPEIGYEEHKACEILASELEKNGFKLTRGVAGLPTAFKAVLKGKAKM
ncbi:MAG: hypothetical protein H8E29_14595 [Anaerolineales bacterium]|uniref:Amidohydrolase n=1 Tax=Candidatus Desulfolinea nitratireducens TaxID=2841698 RepID=A0A8J6TFI9_9CHLR|nr:hypothetical protein [Candidatus Desulfolinea nitratireducens]